MNKESEVIYLYNYSKLSGRIVEVCGTRQEFAKRIGLSERSVSLKLNGNREFKQNDIEKACFALHIPREEIPDYFFTQNVQ